MLFRRVLLLLSLLLNCYGHTWSDQTNITADTRLNESLSIRLPELAVSDRLLDEQFAKESSAHFDLEQIINVTKGSGVVYVNLAHYLFNQMVKAHDTRNQFDLLSPWTWISILGWFAGGTDLVLVVMLRIKIRPLFLLLMARNSHAAPLGVGLKLVGCVAQW